MLRDFDDSVVVFARLEGVLILKEGLYGVVSIRNKAGKLIVLAERKVEDLHNDCL